MHYDARRFWRVLISIAFDSAARADFVASYPLNCPLKRSAPWQRRRPQHWPKTSGAAERSRCRFGRDSAEWVGIIVCFAEIAAGQGALGQSVGMAAIFDFETAHHFVVQ